MSKRVNTRSNGPRNGADSSVTVAGSSRSARRRRNRNAAGALAAVASYNNQSTKRMHRTGRCCEFVGDISGTNSSTPGVTTYSLNPGLSALFPRLSQEAKIWETYTVHYCKLVFAPACSSQTPGSIILSVDYDASESPPTSEQELLNTEDAVSGNSWSHLETTLDPKALMGLSDRLFVRDSVVGGDLKTYDAALINVASVNSGGTGIMGKLWVEYDISFHTPQLSAGTLKPKSCALFSTTSQAYATGVAESVDYATEVFNPFGITNATGVLTMPKGVWKAEVCGRCTDDANEALSALGAIKLDGVAVNSTYSGAIIAASGSVECVPFASQYVFASDGTTTFEYAVTATGAAGNLSVDSTLILTPV